MNALHIIITDFNGYAQTRICLEALRKSRYREFNILVVDHGTTNETRDKLAVEFPEVIRLTGSADRWWAGATNLGIRYALDRGAEAVILLNNDCYVTSDTLGTLVKLANDNPDSIIASIQRDWQSGRPISISSRTFLLLGFPSLSGPRELTPAMENSELLAVKLIVGGRGVIIPSSVFTKIGLFDEKRLPHYGADHDFYLQASKRHIPLYSAPRAFVEIDNTRTSLANNPGALNFSGFLQSLHSIRSHRNLRDVTTLFKAHYPIPYLYPLGVTLYTVRYLLVYLLKRALFLSSRS
ncbi:glycosyltransferase family 2 protein [Methylomarinum sp. Ch1-1]|uniref:Glycosyltransferase family 2 protein n=1 Tax=Methylomarinum roseum TaxID=3067653 RepID=A0AAU7NPU5_9GAMM|nr:glycosyltransferase family 2 protein [Methylomarinum sp. Ch1-1]MDP4521076.1 glycosyltransferase family 2 protein [Methylomarinum sp. Ch1-1]